MVIGNAMEVAEGVAKIILDNSYRDTDIGIRDVMLFGSTLKRDGNDIDMLVIHSLPALLCYGEYTVYKDGQLLENPEAMVEDLRPSPGLVLEKMGSRKIPDLFETRYEMLTSLGRQTGNLERPESAYLPEIGDINIAQIGIDRVYEVIEYKIAQLESETALARTESFLEGKGLDLEKSLDLQLMYEGLLDPTTNSDKRKYAVSHCRDPTFWPSILESGRLYDPEKGKFSVPVEDKYPGAVALFIA